MIGADAAQAYQMPGALPARGSQNELQFSDFITTIYRGTLIVAFDPKIFNFELLQAVDRGREIAQFDSRQLPVQFRIFMLQN